MFPSVSVEAIFMEPERDALRFLIPLADLMKAVLMIEMEENNPRSLTMCLSEPESIINASVLG